ncbi:arylamine N-acetyltransferase [Oleiharenicola lentus]|uniref:Arylamine N-acetyltransferase n=1 Tax=Oleiharenicola lentus TaxID=2508720 RepID=A0A4Q1C5Y2_9BACT|nr:arylamine N-acetyltransferase [Oleiharenicola lentus]RXK53709.1 arylamine N-acetyltransferase [Oleiharenicola lentus]
MDLDAYFARIGYTGPRTPTHGTLAAILRAQVQTIPFENLDVLLGRPIRTDLESVQRKLVYDRRGGYCFEQNQLLLQALRALGFTAQPLIGRARWLVPAEVITGLTHLLVHVTLDGRDWLADAGMGSVSLTAPLEMREGLEQETPHDRRRLVRRDGHLVQQVCFAGAWQDINLFRPEPAAPVDLEMGNWYSHTHPQAHFRNNLLVARATPDGRRTLFNREFTVRHRDGRADKRELATADELLAVLAEHFDLHFPAGTRFGAPGAPWPV